MMIRIKRALWGVAGWLLLLPLATAHAQIGGISGDDLNPFYTWFMRIFQPLLPYATMGVGLLVGGVLVVLVGRLFFNFALGSSGGDDAPDLYDPLGGDVDDLNLDPGALREYRRRLTLLQKVNEIAPDYYEKSQTVRTKKGDARLRLSAEDRAYLLGVGEQDYGGLKRRSDEFRAFRAAYNQRDQRQRMTPLQRYKYEQRETKKRNRDSGSVSLFPTTRGSSRRNKRNRDQQQFNLFESDRRRKGKKRADDSLFGAPSFLPPERKTKRGRRAANDDLFGMPSFLPAPSRSRRGRSTSDDFDIFFGAPPARRRRRRR